MKAPCDKCSSLRLALGLSGRSARRRRAGKPWRMEGRGCEEHVLLLATGLLVTEAGVILKPVL